MVSPEGQGDVPQVVRDLQEMLDHPIESLFDESVPAVPVAAIKALRGVVERSQAETMMGLQEELQRAAADMTENFTHASHTIALQSGIELFLKYVTRTFLEAPSFAECRAAILERGERFQMMSLAARDRVANVAAEFIRNDTTVLTLGFSRVVASVLSAASSQLGRHFDLIVLEGRPDGAGVKAAHSYATETSIPVTIVPDAAAGYVMESVDMVLIGAEGEDAPTGVRGVSLTLSPGIAENGGVVNKVGTLAVASCAAAFGKPVYVAVESYKFARLYPLNQKDLPIRTSSFQPSLDDKNALLDKSVRLMNPQVDFTPAKFIKLLFTDLGVLTPSAVSDELIRLYQ